MSRMGSWLKARFGASSTTVPLEHRAMFAAGYRAAFAAGYAGYRVTDQLLNARAGQGIPVDRAAALSVPAVLRGRNMICSVSTLPLQAIDGQNNVIDHPLFKQIDPNTANVVMLAMTVEDLLFDAVAWWRVTEFDALGFPAKCARYAPETVSLTPPVDYQRGFLPSELPTEGVVYMEGKPVPFAEVIRFDSPNPAFLVAGERAIRRALELDEAADLYANNRRMRGYFTPKDNVDPGSDEEIAGMLDDFADARAKRIDGYVPAALDYNQVQDPTPAELQIIAQQARADLSIANAIGIDPEDLGISTTSRTYQNAVDRRKDKINDVLSSFMKAITDRLTMPDVLPDGQSARFWLDDYLRADPKTRAEVQQLYRDMEVIDSTDIQRAEGLPPKQVEAPHPQSPAVPNTQISAIPAGVQ
jgi:hypothetical protein